LKKTSSVHPISKTHILLPEHGIHLAGPVNTPHQIATSLDKCLFPCPSCARTIHVRIHAGRSGIAHPIHHSRGMAGAIEEQKENGRLHDMRKCGYFRRKYEQFS
jgi:hypothetical protein